MSHRKSLFKFGGQQQSTFFSDLASQGTRVEFPANHVLIEEHTHGDSFFFIEQGRVRVYSVGEDGSQVIIDEHGPGHYVGEMALQSHLRSASVITLTPVVVKEVSRAVVLANISRRPEHALELLFELVRRARNATDTVKGMVLLDVYKRIAKLIETLVGHPVVPAVIAGVPSDIEIAQRVGASEHVVTFILEDLAADGYLERRAGSLIVKKRLPAHW